MHLAKDSAWYTLEVFWFSLIDYQCTLVTLKGTEKMISTSSDEGIITNDGATILNKMQVLAGASELSGNPSSLNPLNVSSFSTNFIFSILPQIPMSPRFGLPFVL